MIDPDRAVRNLLLEPSPLAQLVTHDQRGPLIYAPFIPGGVDPTQHRVLTFRSDGGIPKPGTVRVTRARLEFRCWGPNEDEAWAVYRALYGRLHGLKNQLVATPDGLAGLLGFRQDVAGRPLQDPRAGWPFVHTLYGVTYANDPIG